MRKEIKTELTKEKILAAAMQEFGTNGYAASSLNSICHTGIAKGLLYHNYENKDALYLACVEQCFHALTEYLKAAEIGTDLHRYTGARLKFFREHENEARIFCESILQPPKALRKEIDKARAEFDAFNRRLYKEILGTISLRPGVTDEDAMRYFKMIQDMFNGYFSSPAVSGLSFRDTMAAHEEGVSKMLDFMLYGIAKRGEES
ncbi:MAG: TetR/AcrR family transcriptional regulator [Lachnospiraceae bacterium]|jgi:AcrR family transcriptional regulator|nr:TetR/AcrR family transcriptional regulator [Lachnospiraceae bacterium]